MTVTDISLTYMEVMMTSAQVNCESSVDVVRLLMLFLS